MNRHTLLLLTVAVAAICCGASSSVATERHHLDDGHHNHGGNAVNLNAQAAYYEQYHRYMTRKIKGAKEHFATQAADLRRVFTPSVASCDKCKAITAIVADALADKQLRNFTKVIIASVCSKITNTTEEFELCTIVGAVADEIAYEVLKAANGVKWNIPVSMCADVLQLCVVDCCLTPDRAEQFHLSFNQEDPVSNATSLAVSWTMLNWFPNVTLQYRAVHDANWTTTLNMDSVSYRIGGWVGYIYGSTMYPLTADTAYEYRVVQLDSNFAVAAVVSDVITTRTLPLNIGSAERPMRVLALADMGWHAVSNDTVALMTRLVDEGKIDFVIHYGDIGYADGNEEDWDLYMRKVEPIASRVPYMTTPGNHECLWNFSVYRSRFPMIHVPKQMNGSMWYSFRAGGVRFVMLDSESWMDTPEMQNEQVQYTIEVLTAAKERGDTAIVTMHRPMYCTSHGADCGMWSEYLRDRLELVVNQPNVAMVHAGHLHNYERTFPVDNSKLVTKNFTNPSAPVYVVNGAAGNKEGQCGFGDQPAWSAFRTSDIGFMTMEITTGSSSSRIVAKFLRSSDGTIVDDFVITKDF